MAAPTSIPDDPETRLRRDELAAALTGAGFPVSPSGLATRATRGGGPPFRKFGRYPIYVWAESLEWARARLSRVVTKTSELDVPAAANDGCP
jgi:hypothetical protein